MSGSGYFTRLGAALFTAGLCGLVIANPGAGKHYVEKAAEAAAATERTPISQRACAIGEPSLSGPFAPLEDVLSVSPLGGITAPGEVLPAPYIRINTRTGETAFERRVTDALAPARAEVTAIERFVDRDAEGRAAGQTWTVHFKTCEKVSLYYGRLDNISEDLLRRAGGLRQFTEFGGPDHIAVKTSIRISEGDVIGRADGFDVGLHDKGAAPAVMARPSRYRKNPFAKAAVFDADPALVAAITTETARARCAIDYLPSKKQDAWATKLGDAWGIRRAKGDNTCRTALIDTLGAAQGAWFTDAAHNGATSKVSAIALGADSIDPERLIFALHGRLASFTPDLVALAPMMDQEREEASKDFLSFKKGDGRINVAFNKITDERVYCYQKLRVNFVGPRFNGVILLQRRPTKNDPDNLKIEARGDALSCIDLEEPWSFSGNETTFFR